MAEITYQVREDSNRVTDDYKLTPEYVLAVNINDRDGIRLDTEHLQFDMPVSGIMVGFPDNSQEKSSTITEGSSIRVKDVKLSFPDIESLGGKVLEINHGVFDRKELAQLIMDVADPNIDDLPEYARLVEREP